MKVLGLDLGERTLGVAVSDGLGLGASGIEIIRRKEENHLRRTLSRLGELIDEHGAEALVLGLPLNLDGTEGERAGKSREFAEILKKRFDLPVYLCDERLTTVEAEEIMALNGIRKQDYKKYVDMIAAQVILEDWMHQRAYEEG